MPDNKIEGLPPVSPRNADLARGHNEPSTGRSRGRSPEGQGYDANDAASAAPQTLKEGRERPQAAAGLDAPRPARPQGGRPVVSKPELDAARRDIVARGLKGQAVDTCLARLSDVAATLKVPVRDVSVQLTAILDAVGPERWEFALEGLESAAGWARKRGLELAPVVQSLLVLVAKEGPDSLYDALADFVSVGVVTRDSRTPIADATRALIGFLDVEGPAMTGVAQEDLRLVCVAAKGDRESFAMLARELHAKLVAAGPDAREDARRSFAAAHRVE